MQESEKQEDIEVYPEESETRASNEWHKPYQDSAQKAEENRTSAYTLLLVGIVGLVASLLVFTGVIPLYQNAGINRYFVCGVMGTLFLIFTISGIVSMKSFKLLSVKAESESNLVREITDWCDKNLTAAQIDEGLFDTDDEQTDKELIEAGGISEEQKYFLRTDKMKKIIQDKFMNLGEDFLDHFVDGYYQNLF